MAVRSVRSLPRPVHAAVPDRRDLAVRAAGAAACRGGDRRRRRWRDSHRQLHGRARPREPRPARRSSASSRSTPGFATTTTLPSGAFSSRRRPTSSCSKSAIATTARSGSPTSCSPIRIRSTQRLPHGAIVFSRWPIVSAESLALAEGPGVLAARVTLDWQRHAGDGARRRTCTGRSARGARDCVTPSWRASRPSPPRTRSR